MTYQVINGNNIEVLKTFPDNHFDSVVTDPPYGIDFLGKEWDKDTGSIETYRECLRVLKPGGHLLAFSAARTYHHLAMTVELAGFEIRDQIMWIYSSGFPKSHDIGRKIQKQLGVTETVTIKQHDIRKNGYVAKKPIVELEQVVPTDALAKEWEGWGNALKPAHEPIVMARKPVKGSIVNNVQVYGTGAINIDDSRVGDEKKFPSNVIGEIEGYQKYFYCPKVSRKERHTGTDNNHPTVKPVELMKYLVTLVTPKGGTVLDPFNGSGSTGMACVELGFNYVGIDLDSNYVDISVKRIEAHNKKHNFESELFVIE